MILSRAQLAKLAAEIDEKRKKEGKVTACLTKEQMKQYFKFVREQQGRTCIVTQEQFDYIINEGIKQEIAKQRKEVNTNPTLAQKEAGNYKMGHISIKGFDITIENPKGSYRKGKDRNGKEWKTLMHCDYGYFTKTLGKDGDAIDVFIGPNPENGKIYPIDQFVHGEFDETKVMFGFDSEEEAKKTYLSNYSKDWKGFKYISEVDLDTFKRWLYDGKRQRKPFAKYKSLNESTHYNSEGEKFLKKCPKCGGKIGTFIEGEPIYKCTKCGKYFGVLQFKNK